MGVRLLSRWEVGSGEAWGGGAGEADMPRGQLQQGQRLHTDKSPQQLNEESRLAC